MKVDLKCFAALSGAYECDYRDGTRHEVPDGQTVADLVQIAGVPKTEVKIIFVNGKKAELSTILKDGDKVAVAPATGGM
jgi:sulfur carrier protein ThiS